MLEREMGLRGERKEKMFLGRGSSRCLLDLDEDEGEWVALEVWSK